MLALTEKRRKFVWAMLSDPYGTQADWAREAGYSDSSEGCKVRGHQAFQDPKVQAAALEVSRATLGALGPVLAASGLLRIAAKPDHPQHVKALELLANRVGLQEKQQIEVTHRDLTGDALMARIRELAKKHGLDERKLLGMNAVDAEYEVIDERRIQGGVVSSGSGAAGGFGEPGGDVQEERGDGDGAQLPGSD